jgi:hypothetical protein
LSRAGGGRNVYLWRPECQRFGKKTDSRLFGQINDFCSSVQSQTVDEIQRSCHPERVVLKRKETLIGTFTHVKWEIESFPKNLFSLMVPTSSPLNNYYSKDMESMLAPRMFEVSEMMGNQGIAAVVEGRRFGTSHND